MFTVDGRKLGNIKKALVLFYSKIVLNKISLVQRNIFRRIERKTKSYIKIKSDIIILIIINFFCY